MFKVLKNRVLLVKDAIRTRWQVESQEGLL